MTSARYTGSDDGASVPMSSSLAVPNNLPEDVTAINNKQHIGCVYTHIRCETTITTDNIEMLAQPPSKNMSYMTYVSDAVLRPIIQYCHIQSYINSVICTDISLFWHHNSVEYLHQKLESYLFVRIHIFCLLIG